MRIRPKVMTAYNYHDWAFADIFWSTNAGSDLMKRIAAPIAGGNLHRHSYWSCSFIR